MVQMRSTAALAGLLMAAGLARAGAAGQSNRIEVDRAMWGLGMLIDVTSELGERCNGKQACAFRVSPETFGGRAPPGSGTHRLYVPYSCGARTGHRAFGAADFSWITLQCG